MRIHGLIGVLMLGLVWQFVSILDVVDSFFLPSPVDTVLELYRQAMEEGFAADVWETFSRVLFAFGIACGVGVPIGLVLGVKSSVYRSFEFIIDFFRSTPATALFPLFLVVFGISDNSKIAAAAFASLLIVLFNTSYGVINGAKSRIQAVKLMGAGRWDLLTKVVLWESLPQTLVGLRQAVSLSLVIIIVTEMFIGTEVGLGRRIIDFQITYNIEAMYGAILTAGVLGYLLNLFFLSLERRFLHWS